ncbi:hypothetical protein LLE87_35830, partial [Paenibacillus polymyxa]|nr:hypothetical protein [Paenibacillus polymyxa]
YHQPGQHVLSARIAVPGPLSGEPEEHEGVGLLMARCLDEGTDRHTAEEMAEALERRGIALGAGVGLLSGMFGVGGGFLTTPLL